MVATFCPEFSSTNYKTTFDQNCVLFRSKRSLGKRMPILRREPKAELKTIYTNESITQTRDQGWLLANGSRAIQNQYPYNFVECYTLIGWKKTHSKTEFSTSA